MVRDQVADGAHLAIKDKTRGLGVAGRAADGQGTRSVWIEGCPLGCSPGLGQQVWHGAVGAAELLLSRHNVVVSARNSPQAVGQQGVVVQLGERLGASGMTLSEQDLLKDELEIVLDELHGREAGE